MASGSNLVGFTGGGRGGLRGLSGSGVRRPTYSNYGSGFSRRQTGMATTEIIPNPGIPTSSRGVGPARAGTPSTDLAAWIKDRRNELTGARDAAALDKLSSGATGAFIDYAKLRIANPLSADDKTYWQTLLDKAQTKATEESWAAGVQSGGIPLEQFASHLSDRLGALQPGDPEYAPLLKQLGDTRNSINARDFNTEMQQAQLRYVSSGQTVADKTSYMSTLTDMYSRARDPKAQQALMTQIGQMRTGIAQDNALDQSRQVNSKLIGYYNHQVPFSDVMSFLGQQASQAKTPQEAAQYEAAARQVMANEQTLNKARASAAATAGSATGAKAALAPVVEDAANAKLALTGAIKDGRPPTADEWNAYDQATKNAIATTQSATTNATGKALTALQTQSRTLQSDYDTQRKAASAAVVTAQTRADETYADQIKQLKSGGSLDPTAMVAAVHDRAAAIAAAANTPFLTDGDKAKLSALSEKTSEPLTNAIAARSGLIAGTVDSKAAKSIDGAYTQYLQHFSAAHPDDGQQPLTPEDFKALLTGSGGSADATGNPVFDQSQHTANGYNPSYVDRMLGLGQDPGSSTFLSRMHALATAHSGEVGKAVSDIATLTQPAPGSEAAKMWGPGGPLDESARAAARASGGGGAVAATSDPYATGGPLDESTRAAAMAGSGAPAAAGGGGSGLASLMAPQPTQDQGAPASGGATLDPGLQDASPDPHSAAWDYLLSPTDVQLPIHDLPPLPADSPFLPKTYTPNDQPPPELPADLGTGGTAAPTEAGPAPVFTA